MWKKVLIPRTLKEALQMLEKENGHAIVLGGGTDLVPQYRSGQQTARTLIDITRIAGLADIEPDSGYLMVGGAFTHAQAAEHAMIAKNAYALREACGAVGSPQIRNVATLAGNVVNAQPAADAAIALIALDARAEIVSSGITRTVPLAELYAGVGKSNIDNRHEIIRTFRFKQLDAACNEASAVERLSPRHALSLPMVNIATCLGLDGTCFKWVRLAIGPVATTPYRPLMLESQLAGTPCSDKTIEEFAHAVGSIVNPRDSALRGSAQYRKAMVSVLVRRAVRRAVHYARNGGVST